MLFDESQASTNADTRPQAMQSFHQLDGAMFPALASFSGCPPLLRVVLPDSFQLPPYIYPGNLTTGITWIKSASFLDQSECPG
jgi:hypothetical protein